MIAKPLLLYMNFCTTWIMRVAEHYRCQGIATKLLKIAHQALQCTNPLITVSSIHINEFEFLLKKNGFTLYKKYENYYKQGIVEYAFNGLLPEKPNDCRLSQNVV
jgi:ribosomal protein S18 acetylase RimI-like enzyme